MRGSRQGLKMPVGSYLGSFSSERCSRIGKFSVFTGLCGTAVGYSLFCKSDDFPTPEQQQNEHTRVYYDNHSTCNGSMGILLGALGGSVAGLALSVICFSLKDLCSYACARNRVAPSNSS